MKKVFILLVACFAFTLVAERAMAEHVPGCEHATNCSFNPTQRGSRCTCDNQGKPCICDLAVPEEYGDVRTSGTNPETGQEVTRKVRIPETIPETRQAVPSVSSVYSGPSVGAFYSGNKVKVYRRTLCGDYRYIGCVNAGNLNVPGDDYVLVRKCGRYYWKRIAR